MEISFCSLGVPSTLNYVPLDNAYDASPKLVPYPNWSTNKEGNCYGLTTTYRVRVDECDRLWVLDSGTVGIGKYYHLRCLISFLISGNYLKLEVFLDFYL